MTDPAGKVELPPGHIFVTSYGPVQVETMQAYGESRAYAVAKGYTNIHWDIVVGHLVDKARNEAVQKMLAVPASQYLWFFDGDMSWQPQVLDIMLGTAFGVMKDQIDVLGAWCPLRGPPYLPTIDPGSGTWEPVAPGIGPVEVIRTGGACVLIKRHVLERMLPPWYGVRPAPRPLEMLYEIDNFARCKLDGRNPLREHPAWALLEKCAVDENAPQGSNPLRWSSVGEDSNFTDRAKALGFRVWVQTNATCNHIDRKIITPEDHLQQMAEREQNEDAVAGVIG